MVIKCAINFKCDRSINVFISKEIEFSTVEKFFPSELTIAVGSSR